jgi:hypothetical protein
MPKEFYTEKDIEDLFKRGVMSLTVGENVVLTELAYEKSNRLGMQLVRSLPDNPPCAPVRPYLTQKPAASVVLPPAVPPSGPAGTDLHARIREAVISRMGNQVDPALLDTIIERVLKSTGVK